MVNAINKDLLVQFLMSTNHLSYAQGNDITTHFYRQLQPVFEVSSLFTRTKSKENMQAITICSGWYITFDQLNNFILALSLGNLAVPFW